MRMHIAHSHVNEIVYCITQVLTYCFINCIVIENKIVRHIFHDLGHTKLGEIMYEQNVETKLWHNFIELLSFKI